MGGWIDRESPEGNEIVAGGSIIAHGLRSVYVSLNGGGTQGGDASRQDFFYAGVEGNISAGASLGANLHGLLGLNIDVGSIVGVDANVNNHDGGQLYYHGKNGTTMIKQEAGVSFGIGVNIKHTMETPAIGSGRWLNEKTEISFSILGIFSYTRYYDANGSLDSSFLGFRRFGICRVSRWTIRRIETWL